MNVPQHYSRLVTAEEIDAAISKMAMAIIRDHPSKSTLFVALLRGAAPFTSKLMHEIVRQAPGFHPELDYMMVSTYGNGRNAGEPHIVTDLAPTTIVKDRDVIVLDDVLDKGVTAQFVFTHLLARGARSTDLAVLATKHVKKTYSIDARYSAFDFGDNWLVGMGMDDARAAIEGYRWLDEIWEIKH
jgi:hypoxanthine phosphoribosyltransferase